MVHKRPCALSDLFFPTTFNPHDWVGLFASPFLKFDCTDTFWGFFMIPLGITVRYSIRYSWSAFKWSHVQTLTSPLLVEPIIIDLWMRWLTCSVCVCVIHILLIFYRLLLSVPYHCMAKHICSIFCVFWFLGGTVVYRLFNGVSVALCIWLVALIEYFQGSWLSSGCGSLMAPIFRSHVIVEDLHPALHCHVPKIGDSSNKHISPDGLLFSGMPRLIPLQKI